MDPVTGSRKEEGHGEEKVSRNSEDHIKENWDKTSIHRYSENEGFHKSSEVWSKFKIVKIDEKPVDYVKCNGCVSIFRWTPKLGTTSLLRHHCVVPEENVGSGQKLLTQMIPKKVPPNVIATLNDTIVIGLAKDLQPLKTVESKGFLSICQKLVSFGAKYGNQDVTKIIKSRRHLKDNNLTKIADSVRSNLRDKISAVASPNFPRFTFTFDLWTETKKQRHFLSLTCHFVDAQFNLQSSLMGAREFPSDVRKTTVNIRDQCQELLLAYFNTSPVDIDTVMKQSIAVTDGGSNVKAVFSNRVPCMCHKLNLVLDNTFSDNNLKSHPEIQLALSSLKRLVRYFKKSGLNSKLTTGLKQSVATRWNSEVIMIESYVKSSTEVQALLLENKQLERLSGIKDKVLADLLCVIKPFRKASEELSAEKVVTVDKIVPTYFLLIRHLKTNEDDSDITMRIKLSLIEWFNKYYILEGIHIAATALNPR